jgi:hypothetical protein
MPNYIIAYHGEMKKPATPEEGAAHMAKWKDWVSSLGDAIVNPGSPLGQSKIVDANGVSEDNWPNMMFGFSTVTADNFDSALEMAKSCPVIENGGSLRVAQLIEMQ